MAIADRLREARTKAGLSQDDAAELLHVSRQLISKWETGSSEPKASDLVQCAKVYQTTPDFLCENSQGETSQAESSADLPTAPEKPQDNRQNTILTGLLVIIVILFVLNLLFVISAHVRVSRIEDLFPSESAPLFSQNDLPALPFDPDTFETLFPSSAQ